ncbi:hypothetical protein SFUL_3731 [Streptomyces microflavus DSM 40593]|uniref:Uncharacterized protein n=1 Tax=Streptomyces microflavus DSM 40593 TaxID=1303692 RepID=N0CUU1_STRMI|nr:hypothetical protein [Streptomyces microflavus]AGK78649.1 hypothetical protein SFUL_3731 [Streptomyces microflavus DSM 40593]
MATTYEITYRVLPAGVGPDDYEPADLEERTDRFELSDPELASIDGNGYPQHYGPSYPEMKAAIRAHLGNGDEGIIVTVRQV